MVFLFNLLFFATIFYTFIHFISHFGPFTKKEAHKLVSLMGFLEINITNSRLLDHQFTNDGLLTFHRDAQRVDT